MNCAQAEDIINHLHPSQAGQVELGKHLASCAACTAKYRIESALRMTAVPAVLPEPSADFTLKLRKRLALDAQPETAKAWNWWGVIPALTLILLGARYVNQAIAYIHRVTGESIPSLEGINLGWSKYWNALAEQIPNLSNSPDQLAIMVMLTALLAAGGIIAVKLAED